MKGSMNLNNNRAAGHDAIDAEMIKYGPPKLHEEISNVFNQCFSRNEKIDVGSGLLVPLPKPNKPKGPKKNLRPVILLPILRKILSNVLLNRINTKIDNYLSHSQSAYRSFRSTSDIIWSHRWMSAKIQVYKESYYNIGIDMSSAFDTIQRSNLMAELEKILGEDEQRMCRLLLSDTTIKIKFGNQVPETVKTNVGSPQGDAISGNFFNVELENALRKLREKMNETEPLIEHSYSKKSSLPTEMEYADDTDFPFESKVKEKYLESIVKETLGERNLKVNEDKTEKTLITREKSKEDELWRKTKKLGSLLGDYEDMNRREQISNFAMAGIKDIWRKCKKGKRKKVQIYKTLVKTVLTYNYGTWGLTKKATETLNCIHRKQLRRLSKDLWKLNNKELYEQCEEREINIDMKEARWRTFGHILRLPL